MRKISVLLILPILAACGVTPPPAGYLATPELSVRTIPAPQSEVVSAAMRVFAEYGLPIATSDEEAGIVQSDELTVSGSWRGEMVKNSLYCGKMWDSGVEYSLNSPVTFRIGVVTDPAGEGTRVRLNVTGTAQPHNPLSGTAEAQQPCQPTAEFTAELLDAIEARVAAS